MARYWRAFREIGPDFSATHYFNVQGHKKSHSNQVPFTPMNVSLIEVMIRQSWLNSTSFYRLPSINQEYELTVSQQCRQLNFLFYLSQSKQIVRSPNNRYKEINKVPECYQYFWFLVLSIFPTIGKQDVANEINMASQVQVSSPVKCFPSSRERTRGALLKGAKGILSGVASWV